MNVQQPILHTFEIVWAPYHISTIRRVLHSPIKTYKECNTFIGPQDNTPFKVSQKYNRFHNISFDM
jgi:hypothetical protein